MKRVIYPLYAPADDDKVAPLLEALRQQGLVVRSAQARPGRQDALVLFLSESITAGSPTLDAFFRLSAGRELVIPVNLDGCTPPEELQNALMARHALDGTKYTAVELAERIAGAAKGEKKSRLPLALAAAAAVILLAAGGIVLWKNLPRQDAGRIQADAGAPTLAPTAAPVPTPEPDMPTFEADLSEIAEVVYVGDRFQYYHLSDGYALYRISGEDEGRSYHDLAYGVWDSDGARFYSTEDGQEIPTAPLEDVSYLKYLPNLLYVTFVNVQGELPDLSGLENLKGVTLINCDIPDIQGLRDSRILRFDYHGFTVTDFSPLNDCARLTHAKLAPWSPDVGTMLADLHPPKLKWLNVSGKATDLSGLNQCSALKNLYLRDVYLTDLSFLSGLSLEELRLEDCPRLASLKGLENMRGLSSLQVQNCLRLRDISGLEGCSSLSRVDIGSDGGWMPDLRDVSVLGRLPRLQNIGLYGVNIGDLNFLKELTIKKNVSLGFAINQGSDYSGLAAVDSFNYLHVNTGGNYAAAAPYIQDKFVNHLMIFQGGNVDLSTLPYVTGELDLVRCLNRDLSGIPWMNITDRLNIQDCPYFSSFEGVRNLTIGKSGGVLSVENCPRLADWSALAGKSFQRVELKRVLSLPDLSAFSFRELALEYLDRVTLPDLSCLNALSENARCSFRFVGMDQITDLSPLFRLTGYRLEVPPQVGEQAQGLVDDGRFKVCEIVYPDGGWDPNEIQVQLMSLEELDTLPPSILKHVKRLTLVGDELVNDDVTEVWTDWSADPPVVVLRDRVTGEEKRISAPGTLFTDLSRLSALTGLEDLDLWYQPLTSLDGIQALEELKWLKAEFCPKLTDVSAAFTLQGLQEINFERCPVSSLQGIQNLYGLEYLHLCGTGISSLEGIEGLKHLCCVRVSGTAVKDFSPLGQVDFTYAMETHGGVHLGLNTREAYRLPAEAYSVLETIPGFSQLEMHGIPARLWMDRITEKPVQSLHASDCSITNEQLQAFAAAHPGLEELNVSRNRGITDASCLLGLPQLRTVQLSDDMQAAVASLGSGYTFELRID